ncbi:MAG TPA: glycosyltransferase 87 family protein [Ktedonobacterales bacterium]
MKVETLPHPTPSVSGGQLRPVRLPPLWIFALVAGVIFLRAATFDIGDVANYHCYALAFWEGAQATRALPPHSCLLPQSAYATLPFHTFPAEYGPLALALFLPPLLLPLSWYNVAFFVEMAIIIVGIAALLERFGPSGAGRIWLVYALIGSMALAASRFDVAPAACALIAVFTTQRKRLTWAYAALAVGTALKFYPVVLLPLLLIESWRERGHTPVWRGPAIFAAIVGVVEGVAFVMNPAAALAPLRFMSARCVQVESTPASLGYLFAHVTGAPLTYIYSFNAICEQTSTLPEAQVIALLVGVGGMAYAYAAYWRQRMSLGFAALLVVVSAVVASKVFSPQYLLWLSPLVALEYGVDATALICWGLICLWTTLCFPLSYDGVLYRFVRQPPEALVPLTAGARNLLLVALTGLLTRQRIGLWSGGVQPDVSERDRHTSEMRVTE